MEMALPMSKPQSRALPLVMAILFTVLVVVPATGLGAGTETRVAAETKKQSFDIPLGKGEYRALIVHLRPVDKLTAVVKVGTGDDIDVYFMAASDYDSYKGTTASTFGYFPQFSKERMKYLEFTTAFKPETEGDYALVIDNANKTASGAMATSAILCSATLDVVIEPPFPWWIVGVVVAVVVVIVVFLIFRMWQKKKKAELEEADKQKKRLEAAKTRPIFLPPPPPGFQGPAPIPTMSGTSSGVGTTTGAPPPSSSCKSCPHIYDATSANCIACEYR
jgi:hypothetical protein